MTLLCSESSHGSHLTWQKSQSLPVAPRACTTAPLLPLTSASSSIVSPSLPSNRTGQLVSCGQAQHTPASGPLYSLLPLPARSFLQIPILTLLGSLLKCPQEEALTF